jgi:hypothetical protein
MDGHLRDRDEFLAEIKERLVQAQVTMKQYQDQTRREVKFQVGIGCGSGYNKGQPWA